MPAGVEPTITCDARPSMCVAFLIHIEHYLILFCYRKIMYYVVFMYKLNVSQYILNISVHIFAFNTYLYYFTEINIVHSLLFTLQKSLFAS